MMSAQDVYKMEYKERRGFLVEQRRERRNVGYDGRWWLVLRCKADFILILILALLCIILRNRRDEP